MHTESALLSPRDEILVVRGMSKRFGRVEALRGVGFSVLAGEVLGLIGPNGAGKTTLLECLCGLLPTDDGEVPWRGSPLPPGRRRSVMFYVPDEIIPYPEHTLGQVLTLFKEVFSRPAEAADEVVERLHLSSMWGCPAGQLSKGWRRRLLLGVGLLTPHPVLVLDEPFDGFDLRQTREAMSFLREVASRGRTLLLSIHQLSDAERVCERFVLLSEGSVVGEGTLKELRTSGGLETGGLEEVFLALS